MSRIFISYKRADKEKVFKIKEKIESKLGEKCWIDLDGIESDAQFVSVIIKAIDKAEIVLFMYSYEHSFITNYEKDWTIRELSYADTEEKRIVFVNIDGSPLTKWFKFMYSQKQQVDATSNESLIQLNKNLKCWLNITTNSEKKEILYKKNGTEEKLYPKPRRDKWGYINKEKKWVIPVTYDYAYTFSEGWACVCLNRKWGFVNCQGQEVIPLLYDEAMNFKDGLAAVKLNQKWGYIDKKENIIIPFDYDGASSFHSGLATVYILDKKMKIDKKGKILEVSQFTK